MKACSRVEFASPLALGARVFQAFVVLGLVSSFFLTTSVEAATATAPSEVSPARDAARAPAGKSIQKRKKGKRARKAKRARKVRRAKTRARAKKAPAPVATPAPAAATAIEAAPAPVPAPQN